MADLLISVSQFSKQVAIDKLQLDPAKITVLPMGVSEPGTNSPTEPSIPALKSLQPYVLSVGSTLSRKNLEAIPVLLKEINRRRLGVNLVRVGERLPQKLVDKIMLCEPQTKLLELGFISEQDLSDCYVHSAATFVPSKLEGFGLPVLEAMIHGSPVICSDKSSLPEVGGDSALYFPIESPEQAAEQLARILKDNTHRLSLIKRGKQRARKYSWEAHREGLKGIYMHSMTIAQNRKQSI